MGDETEREEGGPGLALNEPRAPLPGAMFSVCVFGVPVYFSLDILICVLVLAAAIVPASGAGGLEQGSWALWAAALAATTLIGVGVHETAHALTAVVLRVGLRHIFVGLMGGHTMVLKPGENWVRDALVSAAGPASNFVLAVAAGVLWARTGSSPEWETFAGFMLWGNLWLGGSNLLPIGTLDGAGVLRALMRPFSRDGRNAATNARFIGASIVAVPLIVIGVLGLLVGVWLGLFLIAGGAWHFVSAISKQDGGEEIATLSALPVVKVMGAGVRIAPGASARTLVESHLRRRNSGQLELVERPYVVMDESGRVFGILTNAMIHEVMGERWEWETLTVASIMTPISRVPVVAPSTSATSALVLAIESDCDGVLVMDEGELIGCVTMTHLDEVIRREAA